MDDGDLEPPPYSYGAKPDYDQNRSNDLIRDSSIIQGSPSDSHNALGSLDRQSSDLNDRYHN